MDTAKKSRIQLSIAERFLLRHCRHIPTHVDTTSRACRLLKNKGLICKNRQGLYEATEKGRKLILS